MSQPPLPAASSRVLPADPTDPGPALVPTRSSAASRWAISRGQLFLLLAIFMPAIASMLAPMISGDISYQVRTGQLTLEAGQIVDRDPFTFTVGGEPWLNQQWGASVLFAAVYDTVGWAGLLLLRAVLIGITFGLVYAACRAIDASRMVASIVTLGAFIVAATNLALRSQTFGVLCFAAIVAILVWRGRYPRLLWIIPLILLAWANTHGSFFVGWAAVGVALLEDLGARRRLARTTFVVALLSVLATLIGPWGVGMWAYVVELSTNPVIASLVSEWQAPTLRTPTGILFFASVAFVLGLLLVRGRVISWLQLLWLAGLALLGLLAVRNAIWWAIGAAPIVALLASGLVVRGRRLGDPAFDAPRGLGYTAIAGAAGILALAVLPLWRPIDSLYGPADLVLYAPRGVTEVLRDEARPGDRLFAEQKWGSWFELALPGVPVMVDTRIELFDAGVWGDYLHVITGRADWAEILDRWDVTFVAILADDAPLETFLGADPAWELRHRDDEGLVYRRVEPGT